MSTFVSYSRADNPVERLARLRDHLSGHYPGVYVDDLDWMTSGDNRLEIVCNQLLKASAFVAVVSDNYLKTPWTAWEFNVATARGVPKFAYLPNGALVNERSSNWPFAFPVSLQIDVALVTIPSSAAMNALEQ
jgi:hypothetical protein